jgi:hypothetical protein
MEVRPWTRLIDLPDTNRMQILVEVEEPVIGKVGPEQPARVTLRDLCRQFLDFRLTVVTLPPKFDMEFGSNGIQSGVPGNTPGDVSSA